MRKFHTLKDPNTRKESPTDIWHCDPPSMVLGLAYC